MKITILGDCGDIPNRNNANSSFLIQTKDTNVLFDCGSGVLSKLTEHIKLDQLDAIIISHFHPDHFTDLLCIKKTFDLSSEFFGWKPLTVYCPQPPKELEPLVVSPYIHYVFYDKKDLDYHFSFKDFRFRFIKTKHATNINSFMCSVEETETGAKVSFSGDISSYSDNQINFLSGSKALFCDSYILEEYQDEDSTHLSPTKAIRFAETARVPMVVLTHFNTFVPFSEYISELNAANPKIPTYIGNPKDQYNF